MTLGEWERLISIVEAGRTGVEEIQRLCDGAEYKIPGRHETWDAYHEGRSSLAGEIESRSSGATVLGTARHPLTHTPEGDTT